MSARYLYDHPYIPGKKISRQRLWAIERRKDGRCPTCGKKKRKKQDGTVKPGNCPACQTKVRIRRRQRAQPIAA